MNNNNSNKRKQDFKEENSNKKIHNNQLCFLNLPNTLQQLIIDYLQIYEIPRLRKCNKWTKQMFSVHKNYRPIIFEDLMDQYGEDILVHRLGKRKDINLLFQKIHTIKLLVELFSSIKINRVITTKHIPHMMILSNYTIIHLKNFPNPIKLTIYFDLHSKLDNNDIIYELHDTMYYLFTQQTNITTHLVIAFYNPNLYTRVELNLNFYIEPFIWKSLLEKLIDDQKKNIYIKILEIPQCNNLFLTIDESLFLKIFPNLEKVIFKDITVIRENDFWFGEMEISTIKITKEKQLMSLSHLKENKKRCGLTINGGFLCQGPCNRMVYSINIHGYCIDCDGVFGSPNEPCKKCRMYNTQKTDFGDCVEC